MKSEPSALEALLEAASKPTPDSGDLDEFREWRAAKSWLEDHQGEIVSAGQELAEALEHRERCECCIEDLHLCPEFQRLSEAALDRWAKLGEEKESDE